MDDFIYLDYNATTPVDPRVAAAIVATLQEDFGNPSSSHALGRRARQHVEQARERVARVGGKVAAVGQRMLGKATEMLIARFFQALTAGGSRKIGPIARLRGWLSGNPEGGA